MAFRRSVSGWSHLLPCGLRIVHFSCPTFPRWCMAMQLHARIGDSSGHTSISTGGRGIPGQTSPSVATPPYVRVAQRKGRPDRRLAGRPLVPPFVGRDRPWMPGAEGGHLTLPRFPRRHTILFRCSFGSSPRSDPRVARVPPRVRFAMPRRASPPTPLLLVAICSSSPLPVGSGTSDLRTRLPSGLFLSSVSNRTRIVSGTDHGLGPISTARDRALVLISIVSRRSEPRTRGLQSDTIDVGSGA